MRVYLGADHAGFDMKNLIAKHLEEQGHEVIDCGAHTFDANDDYPAYCIEAASRVVNDPGSLGIVLGGSGNGEQIAANTVSGVRAALAWSRETAQLAREQLDANVVGIGARKHTTDEALAIVDTIVGMPFSRGERHVRRIAELTSYEATGVAPKPSS